MPHVIGKSDQGDINVPASILNGMKVPASRASNRSTAPEQINAMLEEINATGGKRLTMSMEGLPAQKALDEETKSQRSAMSYKDQEASNQLLEH